MEEFIMFYDGKYDTIGVIGTILMDEFKSVDLDKLVEKLGTLDCLFIDYPRKKFVFKKSLVTSLINKINELNNESNNA